jgi:hypothetical protein
MTDQELLTELQTGELAAELAPLIELRADTEIAAALNLGRAEIVVTEPVSQRAILKRLMVLGCCKALKDATETNAYAWNTWEVLQHPAFGDERGIDLFDAASQGMLAGLVAANVLTAPQRASVESLAQRPGSRMEQLDGPGAVVTTEQVSRVLNGVSDAD